MMGSCILKQKKPLKIKILSFLMFFMVVSLLLRTEHSWAQILFLLTIASILLGYSISYQISKNFKNVKRIKLFGLTIWRSELVLDYPEYISVFSTSFKQNNEWGTVSALGTKSRNDAVVIRFFKENRNFTVYQTNSYEKAVDIANELGQLLDVEVYDASKE